MTGASRGLTAFALIALWAAPLAAGKTPSARELAAASEQATQLRDLHAQATLTTGGAGTSTLVKRFTLWRKGTPDGSRTRMLARFREPPAIRGEAVLILERSRDQTEVLVYLPAYRKVRRVAPQTQRTSFMGSAFSYADLTPPHAADYEQRLLRSERCPGASGTCHVVESRPASDAVRERCGTTRLLHWIRTDTLVTVGAELFGLDGQLWKRLVASDVQLVDRAARRWLPLIVRIEDVRARRHAELRLSEVRANAGVDDGLFFPNRLDRN